MWPNPQETEETKSAGNIYWRNPYGKRIFLSSDSKTFTSQ